MVPQSSTSLIRVLRLPSEAYGLAGEESQVAAGHPGVRPECRRKVAERRGHHSQGQEGSISLVPVDVALRARTRGLRGDGPGFRKGEGQSPSGVQRALRDSSKLRKLAY